MKRLATVLLAVICCCSVLAACPAYADRSHIDENLYASSDYLVFSPEYSSARGAWEMWVLAYKTGAGNRSGTADEDQDLCVSASCLSLNNPAAAASTISTLMGQVYDYEDMMDIAGIRYYMFYDCLKPCYLANPGGEFTTLSPIDTLEIHDTQDTRTMLLLSTGTRPSFMLLCQLWLYAGRYGQMPSSITKTYGMDSEISQPLYSNNVSDYCSNQDQLQRYCDSLIPAVNSVSSGDTDKPHFATSIYYRKGSTELCVSPGTDGLAIIFSQFSR